MKALIAWHYPKGKWVLMSLGGTFDYFITRPEFAHKHLNDEGNYLFRHFQWCELESFEFKENERGTFTWRPKEYLPDMETIDDSIRDCKTKMEDCLSYLRKRRGVRV